MYATPTVAQTTFLHAAGIRTDLPHVRVNVTDEHLACDVRVIWKDMRARHRTSPMGRNALEFGPDSDGFAEDVAEYCEVDDTAMRLAEITDIECWDNETIIDLYARLDVFADVK
jgi:hypothetical protein